MSHVLVTPRSLTRAPDPALRPLEAAGHTIRLAAPGVLPDENTLLALLPGCAGWLCGVEPVSAHVLRAASPELRVISRNGVGVDNLPLDEAAALGIAVRRAPAANAQGVAELAIALMLSALRHVPRSAGALAAGRWERTLGREIGERTIGVVGCGAVGQRVARAALGFGARVFCHDPVPGGPFDGSDRVERCSLDRLLAGSDVVSLHCPPPADGRPLLDARRLAALPDGAILVNTARAALIDEAAVLSALEAGRLAGYATDVFTIEPPPTGGLFAHPSVIATPHVGGYTTESIARATHAAVENLLAVLGSA